MVSEQHGSKRQTMIANLESQSGRSLAEWTDIANQAPVDGFMNTLEWLKSNHGLGHFQARLVAEAQRDQKGTHRDSSKAPE